MTESPVTADHQCARTLFDGEPCDVPEHQGRGCSGCTPYIHSDGSADHEPTCTAVQIVVTTETDT